MNGLLCSEMFSDGRAMSRCRGCRLRHAIHHPSCGWAQASYGSARNGPAAESCAAANILVKDRTAATNCHDSHLSFRCTTADYSNRPNYVAAARKTAGFAKRWSADSLYNPARCCLGWKPTAADPSALHSNRTRPERGHDRRYFPALPSCDYLLHSETTLHCPARSLRTDD